MSKIKRMESILSKLQLLYLNNDDFKVRTVNCGIELTVVCLDCISDDNKVCNYVLQPLLYVSNASTIDEVKTKLTTGVAVQQITSYYMALELLLNGHTLVFDNNDGAFSVDTRVAFGRSVAEPPTSMVMRGPREGFVEDVKANITLLRKRLKTPDFKTETLTIGKYTNTTVVVCYLNGIADKTIVDGIVQKLSAISIDGILDSSYLSNYLDGNTVLFRRVGLTEKPDVAVGKLLEGRIAIVVDGSPMVLTVPYLYVEDLQSPGDYYENADMTSLNRVLRFVSALISVLLPALYICLQMYNYQIIPLKFLITILNATEAIPFTPTVEMLLVIIIFDILREANLRMPSAVGISLSLVGAIVLGDAAVSAGLIGAPAVMIGALSGIGLFTMPDNTLILSLLRLLIAFIGGLTGIYGVLLSMVVITVYLCSLQSNNAPFLAPFAPNIPQDKQDGIMKKGIDKLKNRPKSIPNVNKQRRG